MKFELKANTNQRFKLKVQSDNKEEMQTINHLTTILIDKIKIIEIKIDQSRADDTNQIRLKECCE